MDESFQTERALAVGLLRLALGVNIFFHGASRLLHGVRNFAAQTAAHMSGTIILPQHFSYDFALCIPFVETVLGLLLILGLWRRFALVTGSFFMMLLTIGVGLNQDWATAGLQLQYSLVFAGVLFMLRWDRYAVDNLLQGNSVQAQI